jgi:hypothetical protein
VKPLRLTQIVALLVPTSAAGFVIPALLVRQGQSQPDSPISMSLTLLALGLISFGLTLTIAKYRKNLARFYAGELKQHPGRPNPLFATRVLLLAQATALAGAGFAGWHLGYLLWLVSESVVQGGLETWLGLVSALATLALGWFGERNCRAPHDDAGGAAGTPGTPGPAGLDSPALSNKSHDGGSGA